MSNVNLSVNPGESKTLTFNTEDTYMPEDLVFDITANSNYIVGNPVSPGTPTPNSVAQKTTSPVSAAIWRGNCENISSLYSGLRVTYKVPVVGGASYGTVLDINGLGNHPVLVNNNTWIGAVQGGSIIDLVYDAVPSYSIYLDGSLTSTTGVWKVCVPMASTSVAGIAKLGAEGGAAAYTHYHDYLTSVSVDGLEGGSIIHSVLCSTASGTAMKQVTPANNFSVNGGSSLTIKFEYDNTADNPTLSVNGGRSGAPIVYKGNQLTNIAGDASFIKRDRLYEFVFDKFNEVWDIVGGIDETYTYYIDAHNFGTIQFAFSDSDNLYTDIAGTQMNFTADEVYGAILKHIVNREKVKVVVRWDTYSEIIFENPVRTTNYDWNGNLKNTITLTSHLFYSTNQQGGMSAINNVWGIASLEIWEHYTYSNNETGRTVYMYSSYTPYLPQVGTIIIPRYGESNQSNSLGHANIGSNSLYTYIELPQDVEYMVSMAGDLSDNWATNNFTNFPTKGVYYKSLINANTTISINLANLNVGETFYILLKHSGSTAHNVTFQSSGSNVTLYGAGTYNLGGTGLMEFSFLVLSKTSNTNGEILLTYNEYINI